MPERTEYETGARVTKVATNDQLHQDFSRKAAENRKPPLGMGPTERSAQERSETDRSDLRNARPHNPEDDARGQSEANHQGGTNDGITSGRSARPFWQEGWRCNVPPEKAEPKISPRYAFHTLLRSNICACGVSPRSTKRSAEHLWRRPP